MRVLVMTLWLYLPSARSLKDKRSVVKSITTKCRNRFNVSIAEIDSLDSHKEAVLGLTAVSRTAAVLHQLQESIIKFLQQDYRFVLSDYTSEVW